MSRPPLTKKSSSRKTGPIKERSLQAPDSFSVSAIIRALSNYPDDFIDLRALLADVLLMPVLLSHDLCKLASGKDPFKESQSLPKLKTVNTLKTCDLNDRVENVDDDSKGEPEEQEQRQSPMPPTLN